MNTLTSARLAPILTRLFAEDEASSPLASAVLINLPPEERTRRLQSKTEYRQLYTQLKEYPLAISHATGLLLYMLARACRARSIVEFGTSLGVSTLHLAAAIRDNGGGRLITSEFETSKALRARENLTAAGLEDLVEIREGDALETLRVGLPETVDLLLLDGAKSLYLDILRLAEARLCPGALIIADNADYCPEYLIHVRNPSNGYLTVAFTEDVELSMRTDP